MALLNFPFLFSPDLARPEPSLFYSRGRCGGKKAIYQDMTFDDKIFLVIWQLIKG